MIGLVWAQAANGTIGSNGRLPWHLPEDLARFRAMTRGATVVMGRRTWESLPPRYRPLPGRRNVVLTRRPTWAADGAEAAPSLEAALALLNPKDDVWVVGGASVYARALGLGVADVVEVTELADPYDGDVVAPGLEARSWTSTADPATGWHVGAAGLRYRFVTHERAALGAREGAPQEAPAAHP